MFERRNGHGRKNGNIDTSTFPVPAETNLLDIVQSNMIKGVNETEGDKKSLRDSSDSIRLKIRIPKSNSSTGIARTDSNGGSDTDNTTSSEKPLKIIIKKSDLASSTTSPTMGSPPPLSNSLSSSTSSNQSLTLVAFPKIDPQNFLNFQRAVNTTAESFDNWNESELASLREDLDNMRKMIKEFSTSLAGQMDSLEGWKEKDKSIPLTVNLAKELSTTPILPKNTLKESISAAPVTKPILPAAPATSIEKRKHKKKKDSSSDEDYDNALDESSILPDEDEIDVGMEDALPSEFLDSLPAEEKPKNQTKRNNKLATMIKKRTHQGRGAKPKLVKKNKPNVKKNGTGIDDSYVEEDDDEEPPPKFAKNARLGFWLDMEPYFLPLAEEDVKFCSPQPIDTDDASFTIPPLGKYYRESWGEEEKEEEDITLMETSEDTEKGVALGDLTQRIVSALIEEKIIPSSSLVTAPAPTPSRPFVRSESTDELSKAKDNASTSTTMLESALPFTTPPTYDFSQEIVLSLEERIRLELRSIGLLDEDDIGIDPTQREDDEICSEIRKLQQQLRDQMIHNNNVRSKLQTTITAAMAQEEADRKERAAIEVWEQGYIKGKRKKRKTT